MADVRNNPMDSQHKIADESQMNGYAQLETPYGEPVSINADRVNFVRRFRGGNEASAVNFEKGNYIVVRGNLDEVTRALAEA